MRNDQSLCEDTSVTATPPFRRDFHPGLGVEAIGSPLGFRYSPEVFGPTPELRRLNDIRKSLKDPACDGPDTVYAIVMDVGKKAHREELLRRNLLFGVVAYAQGQLGDEPVRSQGHVHRVSQNSGWSPPEVYEIWQGRAWIYMQEKVTDDPGRCFAIEAGPGEIVVVPPGWGHATISADPASTLVFGAWCDRDYGFEYDEVRAHSGLAWYPLLDAERKIRWHRNPKYAARTDLVTARPRIYAELGLGGGEPIYAAFEKNPDLIQWVSDPAQKEEVWREFNPADTALRSRS